MECGLVEEVTTAAGGDLKVRWGGLLVQTSPDRCTRDGILDHRIMTRSHYGLEQY